MFRAFTVDYSELPSDVNKDALKSDEAKKGNVVDEYYDDFMVVQVNGRTISCLPESGLSTGYSRTTDLMELAYYLGVVAGIKHEQGFMGGRQLSKEPGWRKKNKNSP